MSERFNYGTAILSAFRYLLKNNPKVFAIGQGLWSPWYVGNTMTGLDKEFGKDRVLDSPICELGTTGAAIGASICGYRPIVIHPRMDFMILCMDQIVNQAAKWSHMFAGQAHAPLTIRGIINRGGEQGAQHSQALHSWYAHVPGLRVVMPSTPQDARDLLIASVLCDDPVLYIDDRWLYELEQDLPPIIELDLTKEGPRVLMPGTDITLVGSSYSTYLCLKAAELMEEYGISCEVVDLRVINPLEYGEIVASVRKTSRLMVVDGGWCNCGLAGEIIAGVTERIQPGDISSAPVRMTLPSAPAPTSKPLENAYYLTPEDIASRIKGIFVKDKNTEAKT
ncbi:MAG: alpha-ketoacid dehydrogenase subunit beta [Armatimonadota bacterium]